jgi:hypothetical protein
LQPFLLFAPAMEHRLDIQPPPHHLTTQGGAGTSAAELPFWRARTAPIHLPKAEAECGERVGRWACRCGRNRARTSLSPYLYMLFSGRKVSFGHPVPSPSGGARSATLRLSLAWVSCWIHSGKPETCICSCLRGRLHRGRDAGGSTVLKVHRRHCQPFATAWGGIEGQQGWGICPSAFVLMCTGRPALVCTGVGKPSLRPVLRNVHRGSASCMRSPETSKRNRCMDQHKNLEQ